MRVRSRLTSTFVLVPPAIEITDPTTALPYRTQYTNAAVVPYRPVPVPVKLEST
jgi:hypothetical protein